MGSRHALTVVLSIATLGAAAPGEVRTSDAVAIARRYLEEWQTTLAAVVAEEHYEQARSIPGGGPRGRLSQRVDTRTTRSDVLLLRAPAGNAWLSFRDVFEVDGQPVRDREQRFDRLFRTPTAEIATDARRIANESARFNLGRVTRNINSPTTALVFLQPPYVDRIRWSLDPRETRHGARAWLLKFTQDRPPYAVSEQGGRPVHASGRMWIEPGLGRIVETDLLLRASSVTSRVKTTYGTAPGLAMLAPVKMEDEYEMRGGERVTGVATYTNHRLFQTGARIVGPSQQ
jgi:hypothetical protein